MTLSQDEVSRQQPVDYDVFDAGDVALQSGNVFPGMRLAYKTFGHLNARKDNVIVYPTSFAAQHIDTQWLVAPGGVLDPDRYFIIIPNLFGNGLSSSLSHDDATRDGAAFPHITFHDAVAVQRRLLVEQFGISRIALVDGRHAGLSLGGSISRYGRARGHRLRKRAMLAF